MRNRFRLLGAALVAASLVLGQSQPGTVGGKIADASNSTGIPGAYVVLARLADGKGIQQTYVTRADGQGVYKINNVAPGVYRAVPQSPGYQRLGSSFAALKGDYIEVAPGAQTMVDLLLSRVATISGTVYDARNRALEDVQVQALRYRYVNSQRILTVEQTARTDDRGMFSLSNLASGDYYVSASRLAQQPGIVGGISDRGPSAPAIYPLQYFGDTNLVERARTIRVSSGTQATGLDFRLRAASTYAIRGFAPVGSNVSIVQRVGEPAFGTAMKKTGTNGDGFEIAGVPPGHYGVAVNAAGARQGCGRLGEESIEVIDANVEGLDLRQPQKGTIQGRVLAGDPDIQVGGLRIAFRPEHRGLGAQFECPVQSDGTFSLEAHPDVYLIDLRSATGEHIESIRERDMELADQRIRLDASVRDISVRVSSRVGGVAGMVADATGRPLVGATVTLVSKWRRVTGELIIRTAVSGANGAFAIETLVPGEYMLLAGVNFEEPENINDDPSLMGLFENRGTAITVGEGKATNVKLAISVSGN